MAGKISIDNLSNSLKDIIEENGLTEEQVNALVQELLTSYYTKTEADNKLTGKANSSHDI